MSFLICVICLKHWFAVSWAGSSGIARKGCRTGDAIGCSDVGLANSVAAGPGLCEVVMCAGAAWDGREVRSWRAPWATSAMGATNLAEVCIWLA